LGGELALTGFIAINARRHTPINQNSPRKPQKKSVKNKDKIKFFSKVFHVYQTLKTNKKI
jgi:hypothetical protein